MRALSSYDYRAILRNAAGNAAYLFRRTVRKIIRLVRVTLFYAIGLVVLALCFLIVPLRIVLWVLDRNRLYSYEHGDPPPPPARG